MLTVLIPVAVIALIVIIGVIAFQRGREGVDLSPQAMLRGVFLAGAHAVAALDMMRETRALAFFEPAGNQA